ncbi:MAG: hypothetical protein ACJ71J_16790 [Nitrososphaeraceae archaeon]|jgi:hypothetical protein
MPNQSIPIEAKGQPDHRDKVGLGNISIWCTASSFVFKIGL